MALIKALTYHLTRRKDLADLKLASDALYSASRMSIKDPELIEALCSNAETALKQSDVPTPILSVVRSIVNSIGQLGMYHKGLLDGISKLYEQQIKDGVKLDQRDLTSFLMTTATLNHCPIDSDKVYEVKPSKLNDVKMSLHAKNRPNFPNVSGYTQRSNARICAKPFHLAKHSLGPCSIAESPTPPL